MFWGYETGVRVFLVVVEGESELTSLVGGLEVGFYRDLDFS